ncbi:MAG: aminoacyl-tRNA hydrolase, partial [Elusimicrobia bacterium]|nr:aminoacyl-tRNA hydrolase [Elusimicrobiota bacterium]
MIQLIVGLGNPGPRYAGTWHNLGRRMVQALAERWGVAGRWTEWAGQARMVTRENIVLAQPLVYMNESGPCVRALLAQCHCLPNALLVVSDDFALPLGALRLRRRGSSGNHRGLASVIAALGTEGFARLRLGIGPVPPGE